MGHGHSPHRWDHRGLLLDWRYLTWETTVRAALYALWKALFDGEPFVRAVYGVEWYNYFFPYHPKQRVPIRFEHYVGYAICAALPLVVIPVYCRWGTGGPGASGAGAGGPPNALPYARFDSSHALSPDGLVSVPADRAVSPTERFLDAPDGSAGRGAGGCCAGLRRRVFRPFRAGCSRVMHEVRHKVHLEEAVLYLLGLSFALLTQQVLVGLVKNEYGRPRPNFLARCFGTNDRRLWPAQFPEALPPIPHCPNPDRELVTDGRRSFPSGHSAFAATLTAFCGLWAFRRLRTVRAAGAAALGPALALLCVALHAAVSRTEDYYHGPADILAGLAVGLVAGAVPALFYDRQFAECRGIV